MRKSSSTALITFGIAYAVVRFTAVRWLPSALVMDAFVAFIAAPLAVLTGLCIGRLTLRGVGFCSAALQVLICAVATIVYVVAGYRGSTLLRSISIQLLQHHAAAIVAALFVAVLSPVLWLWALSKVVPRLQQIS